MKKTNNCDFILIWTIIFSILNIIHIYFPIHLIIEDIKNLNYSNSIYELPTETIYPEKIKNIVDNVKNKSYGEVDIQNEISNLRKEHNQILLKMKSEFKIRPI